MFHHFDVVTNQLKDIPNVKDANYIIHMASVASPVYYRKFPMETLDANIVGLRKLLEFYKHQNIDGLLMFSSSEIYGEPIPEQIPTPEEYRGNVATIGPRACYDEAKRFSETLCYLFSKVYNMSVTLVRPFNNYGPGMNINDGVFRRILLARSWKIATLQFIPTVLRHEHFVIFRCHCRLFKNAGL